MREIKIIIGGMKKIKDDVIKILEEIEGLSKSSRIRNDERKIDDEGKSMGKIGIEEESREEEKNVRIRKLDIDVIGMMRKKIVMIVKRKRKKEIGIIMEDEVIVKEGNDLMRSR